MENLDVYVQKIMKKRFKDVLDDYQKGKIHREAEALRSKRQLQDKLQAAQNAGNCLWLYKMKISWYRFSGNKHYYRSIDDIELRQKELAKDSIWRHAIIVCLLISSFYITGGTIFCCRSPLPVPICAAFGTIDCVTLLFAFPASAFWMAKMIKPGSRKLSVAGLLAISFYIGWLIWVGLNYAWPRWDTLCFIYPLLAVLLNFIVLLIAAGVATLVEKRLNSLTN